MGKLGEKIEDLFTVKQTKYTGKRVLITFAFVILAVMSLPLYFMYEDYAYEKYLQEYSVVSNNVKAYYEANGQYPVGEEISWESEKDLRIFFEENKLNYNRRLYYIDNSLMSEAEDYENTYIIDIDYGTLFTSEFKIYHFERWHLPR